MATATSPRNNSDELHAIIRTTHPDVTPFLETASRVANDQLSGKGLPEETLKLIELYLAAHFLGHWERIPTHEKIGDVYSIYQGRTGMGLTGSQYGQTAIGLDYTGTLDNFAHGRVSFQVL